MAKVTMTIAPGVVKPALCLDLDGTVRYSKGGGFIDGPSDIALFDDVEEKIWRYRKEGYLIFGITNQGGVAHGYKTPTDNDAELDVTTALFEKNPFHIIKACFHHENGTVPPYNHRSLLRKPDIGMLVLCEVEACRMGVIVDWGNSLFVGDMSADEQCAKRAGISFQWAWDFFGREIPKVEY